MTTFIAGISTTIASMQAAVSAAIVPIICIAGLAVSVCALYYLVTELQQLQSLAKETVAAVQLQIKTGGIKKEEITGHSVYVITYKGTTDVVYVGRTSNFAKRQYAHQLAPAAKYPIEEYTMVVIATNLDLDYARALEQALITAYGIDTLNNIINSIAERNLGEFSSEFNQINGLIASAFDPE